MISHDIVEQLAKKKQIDTFSIVREYLQLLFLKYLYKNKEAEVVYFKGGTAIHFIYNSFRFSEDLDFTSRLKEVQTKNLVEKTFQEFSQEASRVKLDEQKTTKGLKFRIKHLPEKASQVLPIRLDFSFREKPVQTDVTSIETDFPIIPYPLVSHLAIEELLAEKVRALLVRGEPRDLFDLWYLLSRSVVLKQALIMKKLAIYPRYSKLEEQSLYKILVEKIQEVSQAELKQDLNRFLPENYRGFYQKLPNLLVEKLRTARLGAT